jgi:2-succinyl-5-enolpyruvyl-6-hydroxy-3-cyclohexene-1-carboxylate synthase
VAAVNPSEALATVLVDELCRLGTTHALLAPGSRSAPLALALESDDRIELHVRLDERSAAFTALGMARVTRRPPLLLSTSGTAAANFHPAVLEAHHGRVPLIVATADRPPELRATAANQTIDQIKLYGAAVRFFAEVGAPEDRAESLPYWRSLAGRAYAAAAGSPPGPVHLNVAFRDPLVPQSGSGAWSHGLGGRPGGRPWIAAPSPARSPATEEVEMLADAITRVETGIVVAGDRDVDPAPLVALAEAARWPLLAEPTSNARWGAPTISTFDALLRHQGFARAHRPQLVVRTGKAALSKPLARFLDAGVEQVLIDRDGAWLDPDRTVSRIIGADEARLCGAVAEALPSRPPSAWWEEWLEAEARARKALDAALDDDEEPSEPRVARDLAALAPDGSILVGASSMPVRDLNSFMAPRRRLRVLANRGVSGIDGFNSTALGVAAAHSGPVLALAGDLSLLHDQNGLLAPRPEVDLSLVVLNNDGGGIFSFLPQASLPHGFERLFGTPHGLDLAALARLHACSHVLLERASDLAEALRDPRGIRIVEVRTDRAQNAALHQRLWDVVAAALGTTA